MLFWGFSSMNSKDISATGKSLKKWSYKSNKHGFHHWHLSPVVSISQINVSYCLLDTEWQVAFQRKSPQLIVSEQYAAPLLPIGVWEQNTSAQTLQGIAQQYPVHQTIRADLTQTSSGAWLKCTKIVIFPFPI